ncbi:unnamed protein product [Symbiodinium sp. KB8]|nr:unnamed protein product [Symbiodinium sp. KB8]
MARSSKLITASVALVACIALHSLAFLSGPAPATQLRGSTPLEVAAGAAVPAVMMTPTAAMAADGEGMPSVVLGVGILCMLAAFSAVSSVISATEENHARADEWKVLVLVSWKSQGGPARASYWLRACEECGITSLIDFGGQFVCCRARWLMLSSRKPIYRP